MRRAISAGILATCVTAGLAVIPLAWPHLPQLEAIIILASLFVVSATAAIVWLWPEEASTLPLPTVTNTIRGGFSGQAIFGDVHNHVNQNVAARPTVEAGAERRATKALEARNRLDRQANVQRIADQFSIKLSTEKDRKRALIATGRNIVQRFRETRPAENFEVFARRDRGYLDLQPHFGDEYQRWVAGNSRTVYLTGNGESYEAMMLLRELARLEKEWKLV